MRNDLHFLFPVWDCHVPVFHEVVVEFSLPRANWHVKLKTELSSAGSQTRLARRSRAIINT